MKNALQAVTGSCSPWRKSLRSSLTSKFSYRVTPDGEDEKVMAEFYIECDTFDLYGWGSWLNEDTIVDEIVKTHHNFSNLTHF